MQIKLNFKNNILDEKPTIKNFVGEEVYNISSKKLCRIINTNNDKKIDVQYDDYSIEKNLDIDCFFLN